MSFVLFIFMLLLIALDIGLCVGNICTNEVIIGILWGIQAILWFCNILITYNKQLKHFVKEIKEM